MVLTVELIGAPGSGKSTVMAEVVTCLETAGRAVLTAQDSPRTVAARTGPGRLVAGVLPVRWRDRGLWAVFRAVSGGYSVTRSARLPALTAHVLRSQWRRPRGALAARRRPLYWYLRMVGTREMLVRNASPSEAVVLDEGLLHRAVQLLASPVEDPSEDRVAGYVDRVPVPDVVVHVAAGVESCVDRVRGRGVWERMADLDPAVVGDHVRHAHHATTAVRAALTRRGCVVVDVDNDGDLPGLPGRVRAALDPVLAGWAAVPEDRP